MVPRERVKNDKNKTKGVPSNSKGKRDPLSTRSRKEGTSLMETGYRFLWDRDERRGFRWERGTGKEGERGPRMLQGRFACVSMGWRGWTHTRPTVPIVFEANKRRISKVGRTMRSGRRRRGSSGRIRNPWTAFLVLQLAQRVIETPDKPPLTLCLLATNVLAFVRPRGTESYLPTLETGCLHPERVVWNGEWKRMLLSAFLHVSDHHLYYNMASLLYKGTVLERELGTVAFGRLVAFILICSQSMYVAVSYIALLCGYPGWMYSRAAGFSGVLFGLKVILHSRTRGLHNVFGLKVSSRWASWVELVVIQFLFPSSSFLGHACGIASGLLWLKVGRIACFWPSCALSSHRRFTGHGRANRTDPSPEAHSKHNGDFRRSQQSCMTNETDHRSTIQGLRSSSSSGAGHESPGGQLNANELRRRRLLYYDAQQ